MKKIIKKISKKRKGFGILEAVIASGIIAFFAGGVVILGNMTLRSVVVNKHRLQAAYLAQEAIEVIKNIRDSNWVDEDATTNWNNGLYAKDDLKVELDNRKWELSDGSDSFDSGLNSPNNTNETIFTREITISEPSADEITDEAIRDRTLNIKVKVSWKDYSKERDITIDSIITDWMSY